MTQLHTKEELRELQEMDLYSKIAMTEERIHEWQYQAPWGIEKGVVSFSGGKDSTVLLHIARRLYPDIPAVFSNTGLEYPEIQSFVRKHDNVAIVRPKMQFSEVISTYGYPLIGKEVAEAIYYARRIRPSAERERERDAERASHSDEWRGKPSYCADGQDAARHTHTHTHTMRQKRRELCGKRFSKGKRCADPGDTEPGVNGTTGEEVAFSNGSDQFGEKSFFNKEKYLPLCRDIPVMISHYCCQVMKKSPLKAFQKQSGLHPIIATMADESRIRTQAWLRNGCNAFEGAKAKSQPMSFWTEQDVLQYIVENDIEIASVYGDVVAVDDEGNEYDPKAMLMDGCRLKCTGCDRTGCIFCAFGFHNERGETRFQRLARTHPRQYEYCMGGGQWVDNPAYDPTAPKMDGEWQNWNPKKIWVPSKEGLGMKKVFDMVNEIYGKYFYRYD